jgi:hypothetical protein
MAILRSIWRFWKRIGQFIGDWIARVILTIFYFTIFAIFGLGVRLFSDPLTVRRKAAATWLPHGSTDLDLDAARRLF